MFAEGLALADRVYLTQISVAVEGDTFFPQVPASDFTLRSSESVAGPQPYTVYIFDRIRPAGVATAAARHRLLIGRRPDRNRREAITKHFGRTADGKLVNQILKEE